MKKTFLIVVAALILIAGSALWIWRSTGVTDAAALVPAGTVALVSLPDIPRTFKRWPETTLAKIGLEPEMQAFFEKPFAYFTNRQGGGEASAILFDLKPGRIFAAVVSVSEQDAAVLIGFQFWGGKIAHDAAVARLRQELAQGGPVPALTREVYHGDEITSAVQMGNTIYNASHRQWGFISNSLPAIQDALDRAAGRKSEGSLAKNPRYKQVVGHLLKEADFLFFMQPQSALNALMAIGKAMDAQPIPQQVAQAKTIEALGATVKLDGADLHDRIFILRPSAPDTKTGTLTHDGMRFTTKTTKVYFDFLADFQQLAAIGSSPALADVPGAEDFSDGKLFQLAADAFGPECAAFLSWPAEQFKPGGILALKIKDAAKAEEAVKQIVALFPETRVAEKDGIRCYSFPSLQNLFSNPTLAIADDFLLIGLDVASVQHAHQAVQTGEVLDRLPVFASALPAYKSANEVFGFVDTRALFERGFPMLRQVIIFSAALMPGMSEVIDSSKLPTTETIAKHLTPIVHSQTRLPDGYLLESSGPITLNQAVILAATAGSFAIKPPAGK